MRRRSASARTTSGRRRTSTPRSHRARHGPTCRCSRCARRWRDSDAKGERAETMETIRGRLVMAGSRSAAVNLQVEAWSTDRRRKTPLATAASNAEGAFALQFEAVQGPVFFRIYRDGKQVLDTSGTTMWTPG